MGAEPPRPSAAEPVLPAEVRERLSNLLRIVTKVAARDFSERPPALEGDDELARFTVGFRFMIEDLERALDEVNRERAELVLANRRLKELDRIKTHLINSAAHELGTPLTPINLQLHMLKLAADKMGPRERRAVEVMARNVDRLAFLVSEMLDVARLESGHLALRRGPVDMGKLLDEVEQSFAEAGARAGVFLEVASEEGLWVDGDAHRLAQVMDNLVSNALKFTARGGSVWVGAGRQGLDVLVQVRDTGRGLDGAQISRLFQPFTQVHDPMTVDQGGTGLGLYICRGIVESHEGRIWCDSRGEGKGATFSFSIPVSPRTRPDAKLEAPTRNL